MEETYACGALESFYHLLGLSSGGHPRDPWKRPEPIPVEPTFQTDFLTFAPEIKEQPLEQAGEDTPLKELPMKEDVEEEEEEGGDDGGEQLAEDDEEYMDIEEKPKVKRQRRPKASYRRNRCCRSGMFWTGTRCVFISAFF